MDPNFIPYRLAASYLLSELKSNDIPFPKIGIICGSGLSGLSNIMTSQFSVPYSKVPGFPHHCTVPGHKGEMVFGILEGVPCLCFRGRFHSYEGHSMHTTALPVRIMRCLGIQLVIVTNAAGGLNPKYNVGDIVCIMDHFALPMLIGRNPLMGKNDSALGPRFPPTSNLYDEKLQQIVLDCAKDLKFDDFVRSDGTYCFVSGPQYEGKAECKFLRNSVGGDAVGMSTVRILKTNCILYFVFFFSKTYKPLLFSKYYDINECIFNVIKVPEILAAHHCGMKVICLSLITNKVIMTGDEGEAASHEEVLKAVSVRTNQMQSIVGQIVSVLTKDDKAFLNMLPKLPEVSLSVIDGEDWIMKKKLEKNYGLALVTGVLTLSIGMTLFRRRR